MRLELVRPAQNTRYKLVSEMHEAWRSHRNSGKKHTMIQLISARRGFGVSDPRDMIFAHVGFAADGQDRDLLTDYCKTCAQVYTDFARYIGRELGGMRLLDLVGESRVSGRVKDLPSWVPDWTRPFNDTISPHVRCNYISQYPIDTLMLNLSPEVVGFVIALPDIILFTMEQLWLKGIPRNISESIASKLDNMDVLFMEYPPLLYGNFGQIYMMKKDVNAQTELCLEVYQP
jgi:hypothetical protein